MLLMKGSVFLPKSQPSDIGIDVLIFPLVSPTKSKSFHYLQRVGRKMSPLLASFDRGG